MKNMKKSAVLLMVVMMIAMSACSNNVSESEAMDTVENTNIATEEVLSTESLSLKTEEEKEEADSVVVEKKAMDIDEMAVMASMPVKAYPADSFNEMGIMAEMPVRSFVTVADNEQSDEEDDDTSENESAESIANAELQSDSSVSTGTPVSENTNSANSSTAQSGSSSSSSKTTGYAEMEAYVNELLNSYSNERELYNTFYANSISDGVAWDFDTFVKMEVNVQYEIGLITTKEECKSYIETLVNTTISSIQASKDRTAQLQKEYEESLAAEANRLPNAISIYCERHGVSYIYYYVDDELNPCKIKEEGYAPCGSDLVLDSRVSEETMSADGSLITRPITEDNLYLCPELKEIYDSLG